MLFSVEEPDITGTWLRAWKGATGEQHGLCVAVGVKYAAMVVRDADVQYGGYGVCVSEGEAGQRGRALAYRDSPHQLAHIAAHVVHSPQHSPTITTTTPPTTQAWVKARKAADFSVFAPYLAQWVEISRQKAACIDPTKPVYDVLLDDYEKGMTTDRLDEIFAQVGGQGIHARAGASAGVAVLQCRSDN